MLKNQDFVTPPPETLNKSGFKKTSHLAKKFAFTLAEVMITLAIIGVVAAITIPGVIINTNNAEFRTGLRKAVSVLNEAITLNMALSGETPYDNDELYGYLTRTMSVLDGPIKYSKVTVKGNTTSTPLVGNIAFYTTDGMRYIIGTSTPKLYENKKLKLKSVSAMKVDGRVSEGNCGSYGLSQNPDATTETPCSILVDVNGDRKPNPTTSCTFNRIYQPGASNSSAVVHRKVKIYHCESGYTNIDTKVADPNGTLLVDVFTIMITDKAAIPYGIVAQKAMYQAQK